MAPPGDNGGGLERGDLIRPIGAVLKFIHCDHADDVTGPNFEASFEVSTANPRYRFVRMWARGFPYIRQDWDIHVWT